MPLSRCTGWFGAMLLVLPSMLVAQVIPRIQSEQLTTFSARIGGRDGALKLLENSTISSLERDAIADSVTALLNSPRNKVPRGFSHEDGLTVLSAMADSKRPGNAAAARSRLVSLAMRADDYGMRLNGVSLISQMRDSVQGVKLLREIATSETDVAERAVGILGGQSGVMGVAALREIFQANSATNAQARGRINAYARYFKWQR